MTYRTRIPDLGRGFTIVAKSQDVLARLEMLRHAELIVDGDVRGPLAGAAAGVQIRWKGRLVARRWELESILLMGCIRTRELVVRCGGGEHLPGGAPPAASRWTRSRPKMILGEPAQKVL